MRVPAVRDDRHDRLAAANRGDRESAAEALGQCGQGRVDAEVLLRASPGEPEPGDDLNEDQQCSIQLGEFVNRIRSMPGTASMTLRAASISSSYGKPKQVPYTWIASATAAVTVGCR